MKFAPLLTESPLPNILIYGLPKSGKTALACSMPGGKLLLNCDLPNSTRFARSKARDPEGEIMELELPDFEKGQKHVLELVFEVTRAVSDPSQDIAKTVITDPMGDLYRLLVEEEAQRSLKPTFDHRLAATSYIERYCRHLCKLPHISAIFVCHEMEVDKGEDLGLEVLPFTGSKSGSQSGLGPKLQGMVDIIAYTAVIENEESGEMQFMAQLVPGKGRRGGDRFDCLGKYRTQNLAEWMAVIQEHDAELQGVSTSKQTELEKVAA